VLTTKPVLTFLTFLRLRCVLWCFAGKRTQSEAGPSAPASTGAKKPRGAAAAAAALAAPAAAAAAATEPAAPSSAARRAGKVHQQPAAVEAGVGLSGGANPSRSSGRAAAAAAGTDSAAVSCPSELAGLVKDVCQAADQHAARVGGGAVHVLLVCLSCMGGVFGQSPCQQVADQQLSAGCTDAAIVLVE
jgi:hypothetical protein